jgi:hypothetical protein
MPRGHVVAGHFFAYIPLCFSFFFPQAGARLLLCYFFFPYINLVFSLPIRFKSSLGVIFPPCVFFFLFPYSGGDRWHFFFCFRKSYLLLPIQVSESSLGTIFPPRFFFCFRILVEIDGIFFFCFRREETPIDRRAGRRAHEDALDESASYFLGVTVIA